MEFASIRIIQLDRLPRIGIQGLARSNMQKPLGHDVGSCRDHDRVADVEHGGGHQGRCAKQRLKHGKAEAPDVETRSVEHKKSPLSRRPMPAGQEDGQGRNQRGHEGEGRDQKQAGIVRIGGEGVDDGPGQDQVEHHGLQHPVVQRTKEPKTLEQVAHQDDAQESGRFQQYSHALAPSVDAGTMIPDGRGRRPVLSQPKRPEM